MWIRDSYMNVETSNYGYGPALIFTPNVRFSAGDNVTVKITGCLLYTSSVPDGPCRLMLRPGSLELDRTGGYFLTVEQVSFRGGSVLVSLRSDDGDLWKKAFSGPVDLAPGDRIQASVRTQDGVLFPV